MKSHDLTRLFIELYSIHIIIIHVIVRIVTQSFLIDCKQLWYFFFIPLSTATSVTSIHLVIASSRLQVGSQVLDDEPRVDHGTE